MPNDPAIPDPAFPGSIVPGAAVAYKDANGDAQLVEAAHPLPVEVKPQAASGVTALAGSASSTGVLGPFTPVLGRPIWASLSGTWTGTVTLKRSIDGGSTKLPLTAGGQPWGVFTANACEQVVEPSESGETYYLDVTLVSGTLTYRVAQ